MVSPPPTSLPPGARLIPSRQEVLKPTTDNFERQHAGTKFLLIIDNATTAAVGIPASAGASP